MNLKNRVALVTGSSDGIGKCILKELSNAGCKVIVNYNKDKESALKLEGKLKERKREVMVCEADVADYNQVKRMFNIIKSEWKGVDILVNNVGDFMMKGNLEYTPQEWKKMIDSNLNSAYYCCKEAIPYMIEQGYGRIINIAVATADRIHSVSSTLPYTIAKTGILILTRSLAKELAEFNITINAISPGIVDNGKLTENMKETLKMKIPSGEIGKPENIAGVVLFLVSPGSEYINGTNIIVSGGWGI